MKKVVLACLMLCGSLGSFAHENTQTTVGRSAVTMQATISSTMPVETVIPRWLRWFKPIDIKFGMNVPNCQCCYNGMCSISLLGTTNPGTDWTRTDAKNPMFAASTTSDEFAVILDASVKHSTISDGQFEFSEDYTIPADLAKSLNIQPYMVKKGKYRMVAEEGYFYVIFPRR